MKIDQKERHNLEPTVATVSEFFLPDDEFIQDLVILNTNLYGKSKKADFKPVTMSKILIWFSICYYIGVVHLPAKEDHWTSDGMWPHLKVTAAMSHFRFKTIWKNHIHLVLPESVNGGGTSESDDNSSMEAEDQDDRRYAKAATLFDLLNNVSKK